MALTDKQQELINALKRNEGNREQAARYLGISVRNIYKRISRLREAGKMNADGSLPHEPGAGREIIEVRTSLGKDGEVKGRSIRERPMPSGDEILEPQGRLIGSTTEITADGGKRRQWLRHVPANPVMDAFERIPAIIEAIEPLPPLQPATAPAIDASDRANLYTITDAHIGALCWAQEGGADWDLVTAKRHLEGCIDRLTLSLPNASHAILCFNGDLMHINSDDPFTPTNKNVLTVDSRFPKIIDTTVEISLYSIRRALEFHETIDVVFSRGNHDQDAMVWLTKMFARLFENEPRVNIIDVPKLYYAVLFGSNFIGFHHGHGKSISKPAEMVAVFASEYANLWGNSERRYIHTGHRHYTKIDGSAGCEIRQHPTLTARDDWAAGKGFLNQRGVLGIQYHKQFGETHMFCCTPEMLEA